MRPHPLGRRMERSLVRALACALPLLALTACGSGGSSPTEPVSQPVATAPPPAPTASSSVEFEGRVRASSDSGRRLDLASGVTVVVRSGTAFDPAGDLFTTRAIAAALAAGRRVRVEGDGLRRADGSVRAVDLKVETD